MVRGLVRKVHEEYQRNFDSWLDGALKEPPKIATIPAHLLQRLQEEVEVVRQINELHISPIPEDLPRLPPSRPRGLDRTTHWPTYGEEKIFSRRCRISARGLPGPHRTPHTPEEHWGVTRALDGFGRVAEMLGACELVVQCDNDEAV